MSVVEPGSAGAGLVARVIAILTKPRETWDEIDAESSDIGGIYRGYVAPLAAIPAVCGAIDPVRNVAVVVLIPTVRSKPSSRTSGPLGTAIGVISHCCKYALGSPVYPWCSLASASPSAGKGLLPRAIGMRINGSTGTRVEAGASVDDVGALVGAAVAAMVGTATESVTSGDVGGAAV